MLELINEIENALQHNCLRVALGMAFTLLDICGQIEYPEKRVGERYVEWCDQYLKNQGFITRGYLEYRILAGEICYKLRCAYLHSRNSELNQGKNGDFSEFHLLLCNKDNRGIYCEPRYKNEHGKNLIVTVDVRHLTQVLCNAAKEYYEKNKDKKDFVNHHVIIDDVEEVRHKIFDILSSKKDIYDPNELSEEAKNLLKIFSESRNKVLQMLYSNDENEEKKRCLPCMN